MFGSYSPVYGFVGGPEALVVVIILVLLFGGSQLPKLARSLGSAKSEFEKGQQDSDPTSPKPKDDSPKQ